MKKIFIMFAMAVLCLPFTSCKKDWDYDHDLENVYFYGPEVWGYDESKLGNNNVVTYEVKQGETVAIPMQFWCEFVRPYDVETLYYVSAKPAKEKYYSHPWKNKDQETYDGTVLEAGKDYVVVDSNGAVMTPNSDGAYVMKWPNAKKGVQNIYIKALNGKKGCVNLYTWNPTSETPSNQDNETLVNNVTKDYRVMFFSQNYRVTVVVK